MTSIMILLSRLCYIHLYLNFNVDKAIWQHIWYWSITDQIIIWTLIKSALNYSGNQKPHVFNSLIRINDCFTIDWLRMMITNLLMKSRCQKHNSRTITYWTRGQSFTLISDSGTLWSEDYMISPFIVCVQRQHMPWIGFRWFLNSLVICELNHVPL